MRSFYKEVVELQSSYIVPAESAAIFVVINDKWFDAAVMIETKFEIWAFFIVVADGAPIINYRFSIEPTFRAEL
jgi:hypothetical protein